MTAARASAVLRHIRDLSSRPASGPDDRQLLQRFTAARDEPAFAELVRRHGPMVLGVCRRVLHNAHDAEDAFQATFLVLARKAGAIRQRNSVGGWLYRVGYHLALKARDQAEARHRREVRAARPEETDPLAEVTGRELLAVFDEELQALPDAERLALVLCYLEGKTSDEAAREAGCSESTLKRRLDRGKGRMRARLARRGVTLPAALLAAGLATGAKASLPAPLATAAIKAGGLIAAGQAPAAVVSVRAAALARQALRTMTVSKVKTVGALLLGVALLGVSAGLLAPSPPSAAPPEEPKLPPVAVAPKAADDGKQMTVTVRVLGADGKAVAGAEVAVVARPKGAHRGGDLSSGRPDVLGRDRADADGHCRLSVPRTSSESVRGVSVVAGGAGHGVGWQPLNPDADKSTAEIRLAPEQVIRGRFVDVQGQPAAGVVVRVGWLRAGDRKSEGVGGLAAGKEPACWPKAATTDKDGRFETRGVGSDTTATLEVGDDRFATQAFHVSPTGKDGAREVVKTLEPAHIIEGTITYADTGKPVPGARLTVYAARDELDSFSGMDDRADDKGRFRVNPTPGNVFHMSAYAPDGEPYLTVQQMVKWPKAAVKHQVDFTLPRGVLVRGRVTEGDKPLAKATVHFMPRRTNNPNYRKDVLTGWENAVVSGADGRFDICVLPGPGHLLIHGPTPDYIFSEIGDAVLEQGKKGGRRYYAHAIVPLELKPGADPHNEAVALKRGVTVKGRVLGPDGKPVAEALMLSRLNVDSFAMYWRGFPTVVRDGRFELRGCDPEKTYPVCFLDARHRNGATVELSGRQAGEEVTVRLAPCGEATTRLVDRDGKPLAKYSLWLELAVTPGASSYDLKRLYEKGELAADSENVANIDRVNHGEPPLTDASGRITFPALIPGATYWIVEIGDKDDMVKCEFKAESGKTVKLPDVVRKK
jgi:RNA polymerase sigma factor (sigma-70 family)